MQTLPLAEYASRRRRLLDTLPEGSIAIVAGAELSPRNRDVEYYFRQDSDFYYLTGFAETSAWLVLVPGRGEGEVVMFCQPRDPAMEIWEGYRAGPEGCMARYGADQAFNVEELDQQLPQLLAGRQQLFYSFDSRDPVVQRIGQWLASTRRQARSGVQAPAQVRQLDDVLHEMRLFKSPAEQQQMREAGRITALGHRRAMTVCQPGMWEYQLEGEILHEFSRHGSRWPAYGSIVGGGANACVLHYINNDQRLRDGDLVLIDAGCELDYYAGDVTRTFPVNGRFSAEQRAVYDIVLAAELACIERSRSGVGFDQLHDVSVNILTQGLVDLGILQGSVDGLIEQGAYRDFYMHRIGHWLGMDVHDVGSYRQQGQWRALQPGMVTTIEPGIYINPANTRVEERWRGIGIRIEDNVLVTDAEPEVLTALAPKTVTEIEALMAEARG
ncbi:Xaa-Pro aminopeptidase [Pokkaliibacter plantistimulans]|uniref:Xaa-Pro aminopeptidase n=1 Tax=Proteobacteria bacterium 228 TaxID=2083153 RepID=A0A2S5KKD1_9PROT|nr:Xaa-Pro aminopeptidase [Pokkaliibacter plantistimulans]PPC75281.1 Xaa-Pro aminopeptidase [Pokkaliibacter plantistimulans]